MVWLENGFTEKMQDADETHPAAPSERNQKGQEGSCPFMSYPLRLWYLSDITFLNGPDLK
jgi:hypothetical protein